MFKLVEKILLAIDQLHERFDAKFRTRYKVILLAALFLGFIGLAILFIRGHDIAVLSPAGTIAAKQRNLLLFGGVLSLIVIIPVFTMTFWFAWHYRESNTTATYTPEWDHSRTAESIWWGGPFLLILVLSIVTWNSSHALDPHKELVSSTKPLTIQVVALQWKWLFIYPEQGVATVNHVVFPEKTPVNFQITADAPMNSFWIPKLGGQIYAMSGMSTRLSLMADGVDDYAGSSANISGEGFSGMKFVATSISQSNFETWAGFVKTFPESLDQASYQELAEPSLNHPYKYYALSQRDLYNSIVMKYMDPNHHDSPADHSHSHIDYKEEQ